MKTITKGRIPYYVVEPPEGESAGLTVIFYHGWGMAAESCLAFAENLAGEGYAVIVPELVYHDSRQPLANPFYQKIIQEYFWKTVFESIDEFDELLEELEIPADQLIVAGSSMGGFIAAGIGAQQNHLGGIASINGSGSFLLTEMLFRARDQRPALMQEEEQLWKHYDPAEADRFSAPTLLLHGKADQTVPVEGQMHFYRCLIGKRGCRHTKLRLYEGVNHQFTEEMVADFIEWLKGLPRPGLTAEALDAADISREIRELLGYATSPARTEAEYRKYLRAADRKLYAFKLNGKFVGCIGIWLKENQLEIKHIVVLPETRRKRVGSKMIEWVRREHSPNAIVAETDSEAVGFYRKAGFAVAGLGEKYPETERFWCERKGAEHEAF